MPKYFFFFIILVLTSCNSDFQPKPRGYLNLEYPKTTYKKLDIQRPYFFDVSKHAKTKNAPKQWLKVVYPNLKASIDITYRPVNNNLVELIQEAEKLVFKHTLKAEQIISKNFENPEKNVFGTLYDITGNAASQIQFHATDSLNHFLKGSLYFYTKPNYDSILPAVDYIKNDIIRIIESLEWEN